MDGQPVGLTGLPGFKYARRETESPCQGAGMETAFVRFFGEHVCPRNALPFLFTAVSEGISTHG